MTVIYKYSSNTYHIYSSSPYITSASFSTPNTVGSITITNIVGKFAFYNILRNGITIASNLTANNYTDNNSLANNTQYTYVIIPYKDGFQGNPFTNIINPNNSATPGKIYTLASSVNLNASYNFNGITQQNTISISWTKNGYTNLTIKNTTITGGTVTTISSTSNTLTYNSSGIDTLATNTTYNYILTCINGDLISNAGISSVNVNTCTLASANTPTFTSSTTTLTCTGSFNNAYVSFTPTSGSPSSGTLIGGTNLISQTYSITAGVSYTFKVYPVNALGYPTSATGTNYSSVAGSYSYTITPAVYLNFEGNFDNSGYAAISSVTITTRNYYPLTISNTASKIGTSSVFYHYYNLNNTRSYLSFTRSVTLPFTCCAWLYVKGFQGNTVWLEIYATGIIVPYNPNIRNLVDLYAGYSSGSSFLKTSNASAPFSTSGPDSNQWVHYAFVVDVSSVCTTYYNGTQGGSFTTSPVKFTSVNYPTRIDLGFGSQFSYTYSNETGIYGYIDQFLMYDAALTSNQIWQIYSSNGSTTSF